MSATPATLYEPGYVVAGKYELQAQLGEGGMGVVWSARNIALDSLVALKVVRATSDKVTLQGRLIQEARAAAKLTHPAIVKVFDVGQTERGDPFIVMELLEGDSLGDILAKEGRLPAVQAVRTLLPIADALWLAHSKGIVHRDLKPDNVFVVQQEGVIQPKLVDFGIVKVQGVEVESHLTRDGDVLGSPDYMSPEQARGQDDVGHYSDIWSFCVVLYEAVSGRTPYKGANYNALLRQIVEDTPPSLRELAAGDDELSAIVMRGLSKQPEQRFASMGELGRALAQWLLHHGVTEDICGSTLEARWLRGTDPHGRAMRATLTSLSDAWPVESDSGVRRNQLHAVNTLPAPPRRETPAPETVRAPDSAPLSDGALAPIPGPDARPKWQLVAGIVAVVLLMSLGFQLGKRLLVAPAAVSSAGTAAVPSAGVGVVPTAAEAPSERPVLQPRPEPEAEPEAPAPAEDDEKRAPPVREKVSSGPGRASGTARVARPAPAAPPKTGDAGSGKAKAKPGDLISPY
jgi:eukaryotic-like serine/threonine-protein kinase